MSHAVDRSNYREAEISGEGWELTITPVFDSRDWDWVLYHDGVMQDGGVEMTQRGALVEGVRSKSWFETERLLLLLHLEDIPNSRLVKL